MSWHLSDERYQQLKAIEERLAAVREYVDDPGNWSAFDARRRLMLDLIDHGEPRPDLEPEA